MALTKKDEFWYGTSSGDTQAELRSYIVANRHEAVRFAASKYDCGCRPSRCRPMKKPGWQSAPAPTAGRHT